MHFALYISIIFSPVLLYIFLKPKMIDIYLCYSHSLLFFISRVLELQGCFGGWCDSIYLVSDLFSIFLYIVPIAVYHFLSSLILYIFWAIVSIPYCLVLVECLHSCASSRVQTPCHPVVFFLHLIFNLSFIKFPHTLSLCLHVQLFY